MKQAFEVTQQWKQSQHHQQEEEVDLIAGVVVLTNF